MDGINSLTTLEDKIVYALRKSPMRMRNLMNYLNFYDRPLMMRTLHRLKDEQLIRSVPKCDPANMEYYDIWEVM